jgi:hypothetical protein
MHDDVTPGSPSWNPGLVLGRRPTDPGATRPKRDNAYPENGVIERKTGVR